MTLRRRIVATTCVVVTLLSIGTAGDVARANTEEALFVCNNDLASGWGATSRFCLFTSFSNFNQHSVGPGQVYARGSTWTLGSLNGLSKSTKNRHSHIMRAYPNEEYGGTVQCNSVNQQRANSIAARSLAGLAGTTC